MTVQSVTTYSTHPTISINVYSSTQQAPVPAGWTCKTQGLYTVCVSEDPVDLSNDTRPVLVTWALLTSGWKFTMNKGIKVKGGAWHENQVNDTQYTAWSDKDKVIYKYGISLTNISNNDEATSDPFIWNN
jgi:hypothetical protein